MSEKREIITLIFENIFVPHKGNINEPLESFIRSPN